MRNKDLLTYTLIACVSAAAGAASFFYQTSNETVIKSAPRYEINKQPMGSLISNLALTDAFQQNSSLYDYQTDYVLINFWATWCPPCRREMPILKDLDTNNKNLSVLGFSYDTKEAILEFKEKIGIDYPLFLSTPQTSQLNALFGNQSGGLPYTVLLDKDHKIIMTHAGEITKKQILSLLKQ